MNNIIKQPNLIDIYKTTKSHNCRIHIFSSACGPLTKIDSILGHKTNGKKLQRVGIMHYIFSNYY